MIIITIEEHAKRDGRFHAWNGEDYLTCSRTPFLSGARVLQRQGVDPSTKLIMRHKGSDTDALISTVGAAAKLIVREGDERPRWAVYPSFERQADGT